MNIDEKNKEAIINMAITGVCGIGYEEAEAYNSIRAYETDIRRIYEARRQQLEAKEEWDMDADELFLTGAYRLCEAVRQQQVIKVALTKTQDFNTNKLHPKTKEKPLLLQLFKGNEQMLSFFLYRCEQANKNSRLVIEVQSAIAAKVVTFNDSDYDRTRYSTMYNLLKEMGYNVKSPQAWNSCMRNKHELIVSQIVQEYQKFKESVAD